MMHRVISLIVAAAACCSCTPLEKAPRDSAGCSDTSFGDFHWTVEDFDYHASYIFTTPAHQNSWGYVNFNLSNPAVPDLLASCNAASSQLSDFFYGNFQYNCTFNGEVGQPGPAPAKFTFSRPSGELVIDQSWVCNDQDPQYPITFFATGQVNLTLDCTDTTWQNTNWTMGQFYSTRNVDCAPVTVDLKPSQISAVA
ncbi:hypothetical protein J7T55_006614 [Diaporthe amygdali]|uniref:uncharacterized protein n=1 Tax=Phomopsis amygdali TaxID=1214568 RepID=UPI0022FED15B|nr:uncharacterized protein J7T55_006614 [Diaporthe amygdali]KAJ0125269.1 hypothetical protein J7T55_006614 [Diaporthe amygdali]